MNISVIIPVLNEARTVAVTLEALIRLSPHEIIVVDGGSTDRTAEICQQFGVKVMASAPSRARQMNSGAKAASGDILLFLHADTTLPNSAFDDIRLALGDSRYVGGRFDVELDGEHWMLKVIGAMINYRSHLSKVSTGDQAIFVRRFVFEQIGGYPDIPLMEDVAFDSNNTMATRANALAVMAKAPTAGAVKTRLVPPLTHEQAADLTRALLQDQLEHLTALGDVDLYVAFTPVDAASLVQSMVPARFQCFCQRGESLGERMKEVFAVAIEDWFSSAATCQRCR